MKEEEGVPLPQMIALTGQSSTHASRLLFRSAAKSCSIMPNKTDDGMITEEKRERKKRFV